jgi:hypothetical protein
MSQSDSAPGAAGGKDAGSRERKRRLMFWATPAFLLLAGVAYLVLSAVGGHPALGVVLLIAMVLFAAVLVLAAKRSETIRGLMDRRDERITGIDLRATAFCGLALTVAIIVAAFVELGHGRSGAPYTWLAVVGGASYVLAVVVQRVRQ